MASFRLDWLWLYEAVPMLEARGLTREQAQLQLLRAVQAGRISRTDPGSGPLLRFPERPSINISGARPAIATGHADLSASTVTLPCQVKGRQDRFSAVEIGRLKSLLDGDAFARFLLLLDTDRTEIVPLPVAVQILADDVDRLWPDPAGTSPPPAPSVPPANDNLGAAARGPRPVKMEAVKADLLAKLRSGSLNPEALQGWKEATGEAEYGVSRDTFRKARNAALSEFVEVTNSDN